MIVIDWLKSEQALSLLRAIQSIFTVIAIVVGGLWTYVLFIKRRQKYPRANITQRVQRYLLSDKKLLLRVSVQVSNNGEILLPITSGFCRVQQMIPCTDDFCHSLEYSDDSGEQYKTELDWPLIDERKLMFKKGELEIEPGERDELHFEFVLDTDVKAVVVYTYLENAKKKQQGIGWHVTSVCDLCGGP